MRLSKTIAFFYFRFLSNVLLRKKIGMIRDSGVFDEQSYLVSCSDVALSGIDPILHYLMYGRFQDRDPGKNFMACFFVKTGTHNLKPGARNLLPLVFNSHSEFHPKPILEVVHRIKEENRKISTEFSPEKDPSEIQKRYAPSESQPGYEKELQLNLPANPLKLIAFYHPQFYLPHLKAKDQTTGVKEWINISTTAPRFSGHYQPKLPGELGYYDLSLEQVVQRQIALARQSGIYGFCFRYLFYEGKPVPFVPVLTTSQNQGLRFPFCVHIDNRYFPTRPYPEWKKGENPFANTGRFFPDKNALAHIEILLKDEHYIQVDGKPMLLLDHNGVSQINNSMPVQWREYCHKIGLEGVFLVRVDHGYGPLGDPRDDGFDAVVEMPPFTSMHAGKLHKKLSSTPGFSGQLYNYSDTINQSLDLKNREFLLFRGVMPGWDDSAKNNKPSIYLGSGPEKYEHWLTRLGDYTVKNLPPSKQFIFINSWNNWPEGAFLEPDRRSGYAYLNATARALCNIQNNTSGEKQS